MRFPRSFGTLVHPTSFPSRFGTGDLGPEAATFIDYLSETGQSIWQVLPLSPVGYGYSPYNGYSAFAGNPFLISPDRLVEKGLISEEEAEDAALPVGVKADYLNAFQRREILLRKAAARFYRDPDPDELYHLEAFQKENEVWLPDYTLFRVCYDLHENRPWFQWDRELLQRDPDALRKVRREHAEELRYQSWLQYEFDRQWKSLRRYANEKGVRIVGDIPIFVAHNSSDVWAHSSYFEVDQLGNRLLVAGVPPDYFSETGQLWGNPLYKWGALEKDGYFWWTERFRKMFELFDAIRVDHFRGFESCWEVRAEESTAINGRWVPGPGAPLFETINRELGSLPIIAEDLGVITPEVERLRDRFQFPGMNVLQFAFGSDAGNNFLPHNYRPNSVVYSGTHDNDTTIGWYRTAPEKERHRLRIYTRSDGRDPHWELIRLGMLSVSDQAIFPLQDFMNLGSEGRMNTPGTVGMNWLWRYTPQMLERTDRERIHHLAALSNRLS